jgi:hypothetical protein
MKGMKEMKRIRNENNRVKASLKVRPSLLIQLSNEK